MWPLVGAAVAGALWSRHQSAQTKVSKSQMVGVRSGNTYKTETIQDLGVMIVYGRASRVAFRRAPDGTWKAERGTGPADEISTIRRDFEP